MATMPRLLAVAGCAALITGYGISDPYQSPAAPSTTTSTSTTPSGIEPGEHDGPSQSVHPVPASASAATPEAALARFARLYVNWSAAGLATRARQLAAISSGQAHAQALGLAGRARALERYDVTNTGTVTAIAPGEGQERGRWAVVTNESTSGTGPYLGLPATSHVTWATVQHRHAGYVVSGWYPAS